MIETQLCQGITPIPCHRPSTITSVKYAPIIGEIIMKNMVEFGKYRVSYLPSLK